MMDSQALALTIEGEGIEGLTKDEIIELIAELQTLLAKIEEIEARKRGEGE